MSIQKILTLIFISLGIIFSIKFSKRKLSLTTEEKEEGYRVYKNLGLKFKIPNQWKEYNNYIQVSNLGDINDENNYIYGGKKYSFVFNKTTIDMFSIIVFRECKLLSKIELPKITKMSYNKNISNISGYSFYFCINDFIDIDMSEEAKVIYKSMYSNIEDILKSITTSKPVS